MYNAMNEETHSGLMTKISTRTQYSEDRYIQERIMVPNKGMTIGDVIFNRGILVGTNAHELLRNVEVEGYTQQAVESETYHVEGVVSKEDQQFFSHFKNYKQTKNCEQRSHLSIVEHTKRNVRN